MEVSDELNRLTELAHQGKLGPGDVNGGTFTLSNIGAVSTLTKPCRVSSSWINTFIYVKCSKLLTSYSFVASYMHKYKHFI